MKKMILMTISLIFTIGYAGALSAQTGPVNDKNDSQYQLFLRYLSENPVYNAQLRTKINRLFNITFQDCDVIGEINRLSPKIIMQPAFRSDSNSMETEDRQLRFEDLHPSYGQWIDRNIVTGCGQTTQLNLLATAYDLTQIPEVFPTVNGQTRVDIIDQADAEKAIATKINSQLGCFDSIFTLGSRFLGYKDADSASISEENQNAGWYERWVVQACNNYHIINLAVLPDAATRYEFIAQIAKKEG